MTKTKIGSSYNIFLFLLIASLAFGIIGGAFQIPRVLAVLFLPAFLKAGGIKNTHIYGVSIFFLLLYLYGLLSSIWTPDITSWYKEAVYLPIHMLIFLEIVVFSRQCETALNLIVWSWIVAVLLTSIVAFWEIRTDEHLWISKIQDERHLRDEGGVILHHVASVTFNNYNSYVSFLSKSLPFILFAVYQNTNNRMKWIGLITIAVIIYIMGNNASRGGILCTGICLVVLLLFVLFQKSSKGKLRSLFLLLVGLFTIYYFWEQLSYAIMVRMQDISLIEDESRGDLVRTSIDVTFGDYYGLGAGMGGGFEAMRLHRQGTDLWATHNFFMEFLINYGVVWFLVLLYFLLKLFVDGIRLKERSRQLVMVATLLSIIPLSVIDSGYLDSPSTWAFYASLFVFVYDERIRSFRKVLLQTT